MISINNDTCVDITFNNQQVDYLYLADLLVWQRAPQRELPDLETNFFFTTIAPTTITRASGSSTYNKMYYSYDNESWTTWASGTTLTLDIDDILYVKGDAPCLANSSYSLYAFTSTDETPCLSVHGNINCLVANNTPTTHKFESVFSNCYNLIDASDLLLPDTEIETYYYQSMFAVCKNLKYAPKILPATALKTYCYNRMFSGCTSLITAPVLPATTMVERCYQQMFLDCKTLKNAPELPATQLAQYCYNGMFQGCTSLTTAPVLPANTLATRCYYNMFNGCSSLNYIKMLATLNTTSSYYFAMWVDGVAPEGTFIKHPDMKLGTTSSQLPTGTSGVPNGWVVEDAVLNEPIRLDAIESSCIYITDYAGQNLEYSHDKSEWFVWQGEQIDIPNGESLFIRGDNPNGYQINLIGSTSRFKIEGGVNLSGNIMSLLGTNITEIPCDMALGELFCFCSIIDASGLIFPATTLRNNCYVNMFFGCDRMTTPPTILPAMSLCESCYRGMFYTCYSLTTTPELPATELVNDCYGEMFGGCSSLNHIKCLALNPSDIYTIWWVNGVAAEGTFVKHTNAVWEYGGSGIPDGWTVEDANI